MFTTTLFNLFFLVLWSAAMLVIIQWARGHRKDPQMPKRKLSRRAHPRQVEVEAVRVRF